MQADPVSNPPAPIEIIKYADFECPYGKAVQPYIKKALAKYGSKIRFTFKTMPLDYHPTAQIAARYFYALKKQSEKKAYEYYHKIYEQQQVLKSGQGNVPYLRDVVKSLGVDMKQIEIDRESEQTYALVDRDIQEAVRLGVDETPGVVIGGYLIPGIEPTWEEIDQAIERALRSQKISAR